MLRFKSNELSLRSLKQVVRSLKVNVRNVTESNVANVSVPTSADVVVIGGGTAGCNALYQLSKRGINAVLLEKSKLISGTTWHTGGLVWSMRSPNDVDVELLKKTRELLALLEEETGVNPGWINNGGLYIAHTKKRLEDYKREITLSKNFGIDASLISSSDAKKLFPILDEHDFKGALYVPGDGGVDPAMLVASLTKAAKKNGCQIIEDCPVTKINTALTNHGTKEIQSVETPYGEIRTNVILNASGAWSREVSKMVGLDIPLVPMKHAYIVTDSIDLVKGRPNVRAPDIGIYFRVQGGSLSIGGYEMNPIILDNAPKDFSFSLYELDWNVFNRHMDLMIKLMPKLSTTGIKSTVCGPESFTPDHKPIMGEDPRCNGLFYSCGYNSAGMMLGGGCGEQIAQWIINGRPDVHLYGFDIRRFIPEQRTNYQYIHERCHEAYAKNYDIVFSHDESLSGRNLKTDPFHELLLKEGAFMEERQGWERPGWFCTGKMPVVMPYDYYGCYGHKRNKKYLYADILESEHCFQFPAHHDVIRGEALACRNSAALFNMSYFGKFYLCGPDAQRAADLIFTSDTRRELNKTVYTCALNENGGVEIDCTVTAIEPGSSGVVDPIFKGRAFYIVAGGLSGYQTWAHMNKIIDRENFQATVHDVTEQIGVLSVQGPRSREILENLVDQDLSNEAFQFSTAKLAKINEHLVRVFRLSFVGELGYELHIPAQSCKDIYKAVMQIGKPKDMKLAGYRALYSLSCEKGYHLWNSDLRIDDSPVEAGLGFICRNLGEYLGKTKVREQKKNGVKRKRVHVQLKSGDVPLWGMESLYRDDHLVGYLRRAEYGFTFGRSIGQAYIVHPHNCNVTPEFLRTGSYEVEAMGERFPAQIFPHSPYDPENKKLMGDYGS